MTLRKILFWTFTTATILFTGILAFAAFDEWRIVGFNGQTSGYPWGSVNENPWYYYKPKFYSTVMLSEFIILAAGLGLTIYFISKGKKESAFYSLLGLWGLVIIMLVNGYIQ